MPCLGLGWRRGWMGLWVGTDWDGFKATLSTLMCFGVLGGTCTMLFWIRVDYTQAISAQTCGRCDRQIRMDMNSSCCKTLNSQPSPLGSMSVRNLIQSKCPRSVSIPRPLPHTLAFTHQPASQLSEQRPPAQIPHPCRPSGHPPSSRPRPPLPEPPRQPHSAPVQPHPLSQEHQQRQPRQQQQQQQQQR